MKEIKKRVSDKTDNASARQETRPAATTASTTAEVTEQPAFGIGNVSPSVTANHVIKYSNYPIVHSLGLTAIDIPLYTLQAGSITMPITLSYHASGIKLDDIAESPGIGWSLNAGGAVVKEVRGLSDDLFDNPYIPEADDISTKDTLSRIITNRNDSTWDKYHYSYPGGSGSFFARILDNNVLIEKATYNDDVIKAVIDTNDQTTLKIASFTVTDAAGNTYLFDRKDYITPLFALKIKLPNNDSYSYSILDLDGNYISNEIQLTQKAIYTTWFLSKITSADCKDEILLKYRNTGNTIQSLPAPPVYYCKSILDTDDVPFVLKQFGEVPHNPQPENYPNQNAILHNCICITEITHNGNTVKFDYVDAPEPYVDLTEYINTDTSKCITLNPKRRLSAMTVLNINNESVRKITFDNHDGEHDLKRFRLNGICFYGSDDIMYDKYEFGYFTTIINPITQPPQTLYAQDFFGYYNGRNDNQSLDFITPYGADTQKREYSYEHAIWNSLKSIKRLSGNETKIVYEPNTHYDSILGRNITIGLRVKAIHIFDENRNVLNRTFDYDESGCTVDFWRLDVADFAERKQIYYKEEDTTAACLAIYPEPILPGVSPRNARIFYGHVTETVTDPVNSKSIRTEYYYDTREWIYEYPRHTYTLPSVPLAERWKFIDFQTTTNTNYANPSQGTEHYIGEIKGYFRDRPQFFSNIKKIETQESLDDGTYRTVSESEYTYTKHLDYNRLSINVGLYVKNMVTTTTVDTPLWFAGAEDREENYMRTKEDCYYFNVSENLFIFKPASERHTDYYDDKTHTVSTSIHYTSPKPYTSWPYGTEGQSDGTTTSIVARRMTFTRDGDTYERRFLYPTDYTTLNGMINANMVNVCIGEELTRNGSDKQATYTNFKAATILLDETEKTVYRPHMTKHYLNDTVIHESTVEEYDCYGNPAYVRETGKPDTCYVWSYRGMYPVAEIQGASYDEVENALGGSDALDTIAQATSHTSFIDTLDELRDALPDAMITTYTYMPLVGVTSVTDAAGRMKTFHYDGAGRLNAIKDDEGNILETYEYGHKNEE